LDLILTKRTDAGIIELQLPYFERPPMAHSGHLKVAETGSPCAGPIGGSTVVLVAFLPEALVAFSPGL
jgi:hypothetical protein